MSRDARFHEDAVFLMSTLGSETTGIEGAVVCVFAGEFGRSGHQLGPRLLVVLEDKISTDALMDSVIVLLTDPPEVKGHLPGVVKKQVVRFVNLNRATSLRYWSGGLSTREMLDLLRRA